MATAVKKARTGVMVHYKETRDEPCQAAIITGVILPIESHPDLETITLVAWNQDANDSYWWSADHSEEKHFAGTWHWVEYCGE